MQCVLLGVEGPGNHPDDPVSHGPGEPGSVRGEVHAPRLASRPALQRRGPPGLQLQDQGRVGGCGTERRHGDHTTQPNKNQNKTKTLADSGGDDSASRLRSPSPSAHPPPRPGPAQPGPARSLPSPGCFSSEERRLTTSKTRLCTYVSSGAPRCSPWSTSSHIRFASWAAVFPSRAAVMSPRPEPLSAVLLQTLRERRAQLISACLTHFCVPLAIVARRRHVFPSLRKPT